MINVKISKTKLAFLNFVRLSRNCVPCHASWLAFFLQPLHQHTSHWSWCCFTRSKMFEWKVPCFGARFLNLLPQPAKRSERFIGFIAGKQRVFAQYMQKLIPNITVLKMPFAFPQMNLCLASHSSIHLRFFFSHLRQLQLDLQKFNLKNKIRIGWYGRWCTRTAISKLGRNQQSTTFSLQHSFPQKLWRVRRTKTKGRWIFVDWFPRSSKFFRYNLPTISECTLNIPQFSTKRRHLKIHLLIFIVDSGSCIIRIVQSLPPSKFKRLGTERWWFFEFKISSKWQGE